MSTTNTATSNATSNATIEALKAMKPKTAFDSIAQLHAKKGVRKMDNESYTAGIVAALVNEGLLDVSQFGEALSFLIPASNASAVRQKMEKMGVLDKAQGRAEVVVDANKWL